MKKKNAFALLGAWLALMFTPAQPASAQGSQEDELGRTVEMEAFRVESGIAFSQQRSVEVKRASVSLIDAISAEGLGRFPDENVAESLQRITGVQINRSRGEGRTVNIRGLPSDFTFVQFNGRTLTSSLTERAFNPISRSFDFQTLPSEFVSILTVHKTPTADIEEGGLSGTVNVETPRAFNIGERSFAATVQGAWESNSGEISPRASALYADIIADGKIGFTIGVARTTREPETHDATTSIAAGRRSEAQGFQSSGGPIDFNGDGIIDPNFVARFPTGHNLSIFTEKKTRTNAIGSLEFRPSDNVDLFINAFYSELEVESSQFENLHRFVNAQGIDPAGSTLIETIDGVNYGTRVDAIGVDLRGGSRFEDRKGDILTISAGGKFSGDTWTISAEVSKSDSAQLATDLNLANFARGSILYDATLGSEIAGVAYEDGFELGRLDPNNFQILSLNGRFRRETKDDLSDGRLDFKKETNWNMLKSIKFGGKISSREQIGGNGRLVVTAAGLSDLVGGLPEGPGGPGTLSAAPLGTQVIKPGNGKFLGSFSGHNVFPQEWLAGDTRKFLSQFTEDELIAAGNFTNAPTGIVDVKEKVFAGYAMAEFQSDNGAISGNFGVRVVRTEQISVGNAPDITKIVSFQDRGGIAEIPAGEELRVERSYTEYLPSANLRLSVADDVVLRFAASRTLARPTLTQLSPTLTANANSQTINRQNPFLDPFISNNIDISAEWYFADDGVLSLAGFQKDIVTLVRNNVSNERLPITLFLLDGTSSVENLDFTVNEPVNGEGVNVKGLEFSYQQPLKFLPIEGFGILANYTFIDNSDPTQLIAASEHNYNVSGYYEKNRVGIRLSYTWRDGFLTNPGSEVIDGSRAEPFGILDANFTFKINDNLSLVIEAINVLDEAQVGLLLNGLPRSYVDSGRRILFGASARF